MRKEYAPEPVVTSYTSRLLEPVDVERSVVVSG
jgi:hypothetical protein